MEHEETTITFLRTLARAETQTAEEAWPEAASLWEQVVTVNPVEGRFWTRLAEARRRMKDYNGAIVAYEQAIHLRDGFPADTAYAITCCLALLGEHEPALTALERALALGYRHLERARTDDDLASLRENGRFRELVGLVETCGLSRDEKWRIDLRFLAREVKRRAYAPFQYVSEERFDAAIEGVSGKIPSLTDAQVNLELTKLLRLLGDGHAGIYPPKENEERRQALPVLFYLFEEGLFVVAAAPEHADVLGAQVLRFGERTVDDVLAAVDPVLHRDNGNGQWPKYLMPHLLRELPVLHALGIAPDPHEIALTTRDPGGEVRAARLVTAPNWPTFNRENTFPSRPEGWTFLPDTLSTPLPVYLRNVGVPYWFEHLQEKRAVYFQFNAVCDDPLESLGDFSDRMFRFIDDQEVDKLVIDIRWNTGGNTFLELPLLHHLIGSKVNRRGRLFVVIGRATFSAAQNLASLLDRHTQAVFVGEPTGSSPTFIGETVEFELPCSKTWVNVSDLLWQGTWPMDYRIWIAPTLYTPPTVAAFRANRDPAMDAILAWREHLPGR